MKMTEQQVDFNFQGRYYCIGAENTTPEEIWFVLHGQGQLAQFFINKFAPIASPTRKIIAPEGLSKYYLDGYQGRVGASWMTKENRLVDIVNYLKFLTAIRDKEVIDPSSTSTTLLGFSQGAATASRWALQNTMRLDQLILWSGIFPPDLDFGNGREKLKNTQILNVYGNEDPFLNNERLKEQYDLAKKLDVQVTPVQFNGGHEIHEKTLVDIASRDSRQ